MANHIWKPIDAVDQGLDVQITYQNEKGEEYVFPTGDVIPGSHELCWSHCSGDWPGCKADCCAYNVLLESWADD